MPKGHQTTTQNQTLRTTDPSYKTHKKIAKNLVEVYSAVWEFKSFSPLHILRETDFNGLERSKIAILTILKALNFDFCAICAIFEDWNLQ